MLAAPTVRRFLGAAALLVCVSRPASAADAIEVGAVRIVLEIRDRGGSCPSYPQMARDLRVAAHTASEATPARVHILLEAGAKGASGTIVVREHASELALAERKVAASSCRAVAEAVVLILGQTIDTLNDRTSTEAIPFMPAPTESPTPRPHEPPPTAPPSHSSGRGTPPPSEAPMRYSVGAFAGLGLVTGYFPEAAGTGRGAIWVAMGRSVERRLELGGSVLFPARLGVESGEVTFRGIEGRLSACPHTFVLSARLRLGPCVGLANARIQASGRSFQANHRAAFDVPSVLLAIQARTSLLRFFSLRLEAGIGLTLRPSEWDVAPVGTIHRVAPLTFHLQAGLESSNTKD